MHCGYNLTGVSIGSACPECGAPVDQSLYASGNQKTSGFAITSMVLGICGILGLFCCFGGLLGVPGLIFGAVAMNEIKGGGFTASSRGMAIAGLICSGIALALFGGFILFSIR